MEIINNLLFKIVNFNGNDKSVVGGVYTISISQVSRKQTLQMYAVTELLNML